jgi:transglutaminase-like putative cysteine protease
MIFGFDKTASLNSTISLAFGQFQVFSFKLTYHLENPLNENVSYEIALPPDTNFQKVNYTNISPAPNKVEIDQDGNWIASFNLKPHEKTDVKAIGAVQLFAKKQTFPAPKPDIVTKYLAKTNLWQTDDPKIIELAKKLKTPRAIYDYVRTYLSYDYERVAPNVERLGASLALQNPKNAICTEFTDLFIAIARAAGIPAREVEGYAYTDNPRIQPLSLVADVLHSWPEYWDQDKQSWIPIDPTWGSTSGIDYFDKLDLKHFAFVIHGENPQKPYPAGSYKQSANPQKDIEVNFGQLPVDRNAKIEVENTILSQIPFSDEIISAKIKNNGPVAIYDQNIELKFDNQKESTIQKIDVLPPYGYHVFKFSIPYSFLGQKTPLKAQILINSSKLSEFKTYKTFVTISNLLMLCLFALFVISMVYLKFKDGKTKKHT